MSPTSARRTRRARRARRGPAVVAAALAVTASLLAACSPPPATGIAGAGREGSGASELPECPLDALDQVDGKIKVQLWYGGIVMPTSGVLLDLVEKFNASQDKIEVVPADQGVDYDETLRAFDKVVSTPAKLPNIIYLEDIQLGKMIDSNAVLPAESCMLASGYDKRQILASARAGFSADGVLYPGYMNVSSPVIYYNKVHFEKAGLDPDVAPKTLDEVAEFSRKIKDAGVAPKPFAFKADQWFVNTWLAGAGYDVFDNQNGRLKAATKANLTGDVPVGLLEELKAINDEGLMNPFPVTAGNIDHYLALVTGQSSMVLETSTASSTIASVLGGDIDASDASEAGIDIGGFDLDKIGVVPASGQFPGLSLPGQIYASGGAFYMLNGGGTGGEAGKARMAASWKFLEFMLRPENAKEWYVTGGYLPVVKKVAEDPDAQAFGRTTLQGILIRPSLEQMQGADPDRVSPLIGPFHDYQQDLQAAMEAVLLNGADPARALAKAEQQVNGALSRYAGD